MTKEEAVARLTELSESFDSETRHVQADAVLCELLTTLGYADVVEAYYKIDKYYAYNENF